METRRVLGTVGGALGVLPLAALARSVTASIFSIPTLAGAERVTRDVKAATYVETAVLMIGVPAAALLFGRLLPSIASRGALAGAGFGASFLLYRAGASPAASLLAGLVITTAILVPRIRRGSRTLAVLAVFLLFIAGVYAYFRPLAPVELFEDGLILFGAGELARGARPYLDVYPIHGWGADGGMLSVVLPLVNHDLVAFRLLRAVLTATALAALAAGALLFFRDAGWAALAFAACLAFCPFPSERQAPALVAWCLLIRASRSARTRDWAFAGAATAVTLFVTLDFGVVLLAAGSLTPAALELTCGRRGGPTR